MGLRAVRRVNRQTRGEISQDQEIPRRQSLRAIASRIKVLGEVS